MTEKEMLLAILDLQDEHNKTINADWKNQNYPFYRAIWVECSELLEHYGWKWWTNSVIDKDQVYLEVIDILHFGLSDLLTKYTESQIAAIFAVRLNPANFVYGDFAYNLERFIKVTLEQRGFDVDLFFVMIHELNYTFKDLYIGYVAKNTLNKFRQDNGYSEGTYTKIWNGKEDNLVMLELIRSGTALDALYTALATKYKALSNG